MTGEIEAYYNVVVVNPWTLVFHDDHWTTNSATVTRYMHSMMVVIYVYADEFAKSACST